MPPKKKQEALKKKIVDDKTFGLKNKNKSKKVQQYVQQVEQQAAQKVEGPGKRRPGGAGGSSAADAAAQSKKALLAARLEELSLLNQPVVEKKKKVDEEAEERRRRREEEEAERIRIANLPVEEQIEEERAKLTTRTPVTEELFLAWKARKEAERAKREEATVAAAQKNKSKAERMRGAGLTGRQLFEQHKEIFVDDDEADNTKYERPENDWIGDDEEAAHAAEGTGPRDPDAAQNTPAQEYEPPTADDDKDPTVAQDVGDESLFV